jgi:hypothetical protein
MSGIKSPLPPSKPTVVPRRLLSPCSKKHKLSKIPKCAECAQLLVHHSKISVPKHILTPAVQSGLVDQIRVDKHNVYYFRHEIQKLQSLDEKDKAKVIASPQKLVSPIKRPSTPIKPSTPVIFSVPKKDDPTKRVLTPSKHELAKKPQSDMKTPMKLESPLNPTLTNPVVVTPPKLTITVQKTPPAQPTTLPTTPISISVSTTTLSTIPEQIPSSGQIRSSKILPEGLCSQCHSTVGKYRKCTTNYLCMPCRTLPQHKLISELNVFRKYRDLCYNDIDEAINKKLIRNLTTVAFLDMNANTTLVRYFYEQDIERLTTPTS